MWKCRKSVIHISTIIYCVWEVLSWASQTIYKDIYQNIWQRIKGNIAPVMLIKLIETWNETLDEKFIIGTISIILLNIIYDGTLQ